MPLYDYLCPQCQTRFEALVRGGTVPACPHCGATEPQRQLSMPAPRGTSRAIIANARRAAAREGHFSNYSASERGKIK
jgi:putative FmdB family regulatory protein